MSAPTAASRVAPVTIHRKARVYRLARSVPLGSDLVEPDENFCAALLEQALRDGDLTASVANTYVAWKRQCEKTNARLRRWADAFIAAWDAGEVDLPASGMRGAVVRRGDYMAMNSREVALSAVLLGGIRGVTIGESRRLTGVPGNGPSGGLSLLHKAGVLVCVEGERR